MYSIKNLANKSLKKDLLEQFLEFANDKLAIDKPYSVYFVNDKENASDALGKTAMYNPSTNSVYVYVTNRHPKDILRSIAHELMHHKQNCEGRLDKTYGEGSDDLENLELEANEAGYLVRQFEDGLKENKLSEVSSYDGATKFLPSGKVKINEELAPIALKVGEKGAPYVTKYAKKLKKKVFKPILKKYETDHATKAMERALTDLFGEYVYPEWLLKLDQEVMRKLTREPPNLTNNRRADFDSDIKLPKDLLLKPIRGKGEYSKCLPGQEKRADEKGFKRCYPKEFAKDKQFYDFDGLTVNDFKAIASDVKNTTKAGRESVFSGQDKSLQFALIVLPKLIDAFKTLKKYKDKPSPENYISIRNKNVEKLKKILNNLASEKVSKNESIDLKTQASHKFEINVNSLSMLQEAVAEQGVDPFYSQKDINNARRLMILFDKGIFEHGDGDKPFLIQQKIPKQIINNLKTEYGYTDENIKNITSIYTQNASSQAAISTEDVETIEFFHFFLDMMGLSADPYGVGIMSDLLNAFLYLSRGRYFDATLSFMAAAFFGDFLKVQRGPLRRAMRFVGNVQANVRFVVSQRVIGTISDVLTWLYNKAVILVGRGAAKYGATTGKKSGLWSKFQDWFVDSFIPGLKGNLDDFEKILNDFEEYNKNLIRMNYEIRSGLKPSRLSKLLESEEAQIKIVARILQDRANNIASYSADALKNSKIASTADTRYKKAYEEAENLANKQFIEPKEPAGLKPDLTDYNAELEKYNANVAAKEQAVERLKTMPKPGGVSEEATLEAKKLLKNNRREFEQVIDGVKNNAAGMRVSDQFKDKMIEAAKEAQNPHEAINIAKTYMDKNYDNFILEQIYLQADSGTAARIIDRNLTKIYGKQALRATYSATKTTLTALSPFTKMLAKFFGTGGIMGELYRLTGIQGFRVFVSIFNLKAENFWSLLAKLAPRVAILYIISLPFFVFGKLSLFVNYYVRYYKHWCGDEKSYSAIVVPVIKGAFNSWKKVVTDPLGLYNDVTKLIDVIMSKKQEQDNLLTSIGDYLVSGTKSAINCKRKAETHTALELIRDSELYFEALKNLENSVQENATKVALQKAKEAAVKATNELKAKAAQSFSPEDIEKTWNDFSQLIQDSTKEDGKITPKIEASYKNFIDQAVKLFSKEGRTPQEKTLIKGITDKTTKQMNDSGYAVNPANFPELKESKNENTNESLSDYRKKVLEERLVKLTIGLTK